MFKLLALVLLIANNVQSKVNKSVSTRADGEHPTDTRKGGSIHRHKNRWGFDSNCTIICKNVDYCSGTIPDIAGICKNGKFKNHCCHHNRTSTKKSTKIPLITTTPPYILVELLTLLTTPTSVPPALTRRSSTATNLYSSAPSACQYNCSTGTCLPKGLNSLSACSGVSCGVDKCECRSCNLSYVAVDNTCVPLADVCSKVSFTGTECLRRDIYYAYIGVLCKLKQNSYNTCYLENTMLAVKFTEASSKENRNIVYLAANTVPHETTTTCKNFKVKVTNDGNYGLSVHVSDYSKKRDSMLTVRLNNLEVMSEISFNSFMDPGVKVAELYLDFKVIGSWLDVAGFPLTDVTDGIVDLSICAGDCSENEDSGEGILVNSFAVVKLENRKQKCMGRMERACDARKYGCQYNSVYKEAVQFSNCPEEPGCFYNNSFYLNGGVLCHYIGSTSQDCQFSEIILAVNLEGPEYGPDSRHVTYKAGENFKPNISKKLLYRRSHTDTVVGVQPEDYNLYLNYMRGHLKGSSVRRVTQNDCASWTAYIDKEGAYELSLKTGEFFYTHGFGRRTFNVKINNQIILQEVDLLGISPRRTGLDIVLNFDVLDYGNLLHMRGFPIQPFDGRFIIKLCYGECHNEDQNWAIAALYVARFNHTSRILNVL